VVEVVHCCLVLLFFWVDGEGPQSRFGWLRDRSTFLDSLKLGRFWAQRSRFVFFWIMYSCSGNRFSASREMSALVYVHSSSVGGVFSLAVYG
jgi:hypothetical protein